MDHPWLLTPDRIRDFLAKATEGMPEVPEADVRHFGAKAITRAMGLGADSYGMHGYLTRDLRGEPEAEALDAGNYGIYQGLKDHHDVEEGRLDPVKAEESEMWLRALVADTVKLHAAWERYWAWRYGAD